jgi:hypothetical protein
VTYVAGWATYTAVAWVLYPNERGTNMLWALAWRLVWPAMAIDLAVKLNDELRPS